MTDVERLEYIISRRTPGVLGMKTHYAVLVLLVETQGEFQLLLEVRAASMRRQPGEICFPGGKVEKGETYTAAALRETWEELGIASDAITILGELDVVAHRANFLIHPILATCPQSALSALQLSVHEVESTFLVPLAHLKQHPEMMGQCALCPQPEENFPYAQLGVTQEYNWQVGHETIYAYHWDTHIIWGLTARIIHHLLTLLQEEETL